MSKSSESCAGEVVVCACEVVADEPGIVALVGDDFIGRLRKCQQAMSVSASQTREER